MMIQLLLAVATLGCVESHPVPGEAPSLLPAGRSFRLVWNDEFNGDRLDDTKWMYRTHYWGRRAAWFAGPEDEGAVIVKDGLLRLPLVKRPDGQFVSASLQTGNRLWDEPFAETDGRPSKWLWGKRAAPKFMHRYGYYECRFRLQRMPGWWSAFWMQSPANGATLDPSVSGIEHDIMESFVPGEIMPHFFHYNGYVKGEYRWFTTPRMAAPGRRADGTSATNRVDVSVFHTVGLLWERDGYTVFLDGVQRGEKVGTGVGLSHPEAVSQADEFILLTTEAFHYKKTGRPDPRLDEAVKAGDDFRVDYVRVFDQVEQGGSCR